MNSAVSLDTTLCSVVDTYVPAESLRSCYQVTRCHIPEEHNRQ
jgi:hypothetical protein